MPATPGYYRHPTIHGESIVFVCEDDLWTVPLTGGAARRLTASPAGVAFPRFSVDGKQLAYTGWDDGPPEVYVMAAEGGASRRLTWMGSMLRTVTWTPDGKRIVFQSNQGRPFVGDFHLHQVEASGGVPGRLPHGPAREIAWQPRGPGVVLGVNSGDPARWKRYRGGTAGTLWIDREGKGQFTPLIQLEGNLASPMWLRGRVYFLSDHEGHGNLYSCTPAGRSLRRHTHHEDYYVRFPATDGKRIVYHAGADLYVYDLEADAAGLVPVELHSPRTARNRKFVSGRDGLEHAGLHPEGHSLTCVVRGGAFTMPLWEGAPVRHGVVSRARQRLASWLPDGKRLLTTSDLEGEEALAIHTAATGTRTKLIQGDFGRLLDLQVAPAGRGRAALTNHRQEVWVVDLVTGRGKCVEQSGHDRIQGLAWSPDGRYLVYGYAESLYTSTLHMLDTRTGKVHVITRPDFWDHSPSFDPDGQYLYFLSARVYDPVYDNIYFDLGFPRGVRPHLIPLSRETHSPFDRAHLEPRAPAGAGSSSNSKNGKQGRKKVTVDLRGIKERVVAFPVEEGRYLQIHGAQGRVFFSHLPVEGSLGQTWATGGPPPAKAQLDVHDLERNRTETLLRGITSFSVAADGKSLLVQVGNRLRALSAKAESKELSSQEAPSRESGWLDLNRLRVAVVPGEEWRQMFREAWRLQRDQFWSPDMSRVDWEAVHDRYLPLVDRVASRAEFSDLMWEMQGELGTSHCYELGGDYRPGPTWYQGYLGADLEYDSSRRGWIIRSIPRGDSWQADACSPLVAPGVGLKEGDQILAIGGERLGKHRTPFQCLVDQARREVVLRVRSGKSTREVTVRTLATEQPLRYRDWVERNRAHVHRATRGRVGYVHIPNMGPQGYSEFHRYYKCEFDREGLIVDVRWNGGGHVSQLLLEKLLRRRVGYDQSRWMGVSPYPDLAPMGPMVALTNELAGSDGDIFSHCFKLYGLGPLIGKRTWGGVVGIWPRHALVDGSITTQPEFSFWFKDVGFGVENYGTDPDIEVIIAPQDHARGRDTQLEQGLAEIKRIIREERPRVPVLKKRPSRTPPKLPT